MLRLEGGGTVRVSRHEAVRLGSHAISSHNVEGAVLCGVAGPLRMSPQQTRVRTLGFLALAVKAPKDERDGR